MLELLIAVLFPHGVGVLSVDDVFVLFNYLIKMCLAVTTQGDGLRGDGVG